MSVVDRRPEREQELHEFAPQVLERWDIAAELSFISYVENAVYDMSWPGGAPGAPDAGEYILRLTDLGHRSAAQLQAELDWQHFLAERGVDVAQPIRSLDGNLVESCSLPGGDILACLFSKSPGEVQRFRKHPELWNRDLHLEWGRVLGRMHRATKEYVPPSGHQPRFRWDADGRWQDGVLDVIPKGRVDVIREYERMQEWLQSLPESRETFGLIHCDLHQGNFHVQDGKFSVFDFDDCQYHWFAMDLAMPVYYCGYYPYDESMGRPTLDEFFDALIEGYRSEHAIDDIWIRRVWGFVRWRRVQMYIFIHLLESQGRRMLHEPWVHNLCSHFSLAEVLV